MSRTNPYPLRNKTERQTTSSQIAVTKNNQTQDKTRLTASQPAGVTLEPLIESDAVIPLGTTSVQVAEEPTTVVEVLEEERNGGTGIIPDPPTLNNNPNPNLTLTLT